MQQGHALTEENRHQRKMHGVDQPLGLYMLGAGVPSDIHRGGRIDVTTI